jgi:hypothetical protein
MSRKQLVRLVTKYYQLNFLKPTLHSVPLTDRSVATVPIFVVKALLVAFLNDPLRMRQENFASNYDIFSGKAKLPTSTLDEIHTGSLWEQARQKYCGDDPDAFPLALVCFYDKTNTDVFGSIFQQQNLRKKSNQNFWNQKQNQNSASDGGYRNLIQKLEFPIKSRMHFWKVAQYGLGGHGIWGHNRFNPICQSPFNIPSGIVVPSGFTRSAIVMMRRYI